MTELKIEMDPAELGLDKERLGRIDAHFARYVDDGRLAGWLLTVRRHGHLAHVARCGSRDLEAGLPVTDDTLWRIYSMTKPITSVAAMMLYEEGKLALNDPVSEFIPAFADLRVYTGGSDQKQVTVPATEPVRVWHLLTHTSGLTYGFHRMHPVDAVYRAGGFEWGTPPGLDLAAVCDRYATFPLLFQPGTEWNYSVSTDVLGRVVEVASGQSLDEFFAARILRPLGMTDTSFWRRPGDRAPAGRAVPPGPGGEAVRLDEFGQAALRPPRVLSGGGGLVSTAADYDRFIQMLLHTATARPASSTAPGCSARARSATWAATTCRGTRTWRRSAGRCTPSPRSAASASASASPSCIDPAAGQGHLLPGRAVLGRRGQHHVLDRPGRGPDRLVLHPAAPVQHPPDPPAAAPARLPGANR